MTKNTAVALLAIPAVACLSQEARELVLREEPSSGIPCGEIFHQREARMFVIACFPEHPEMAEDPRAVGLAMAAWSLAIAQAERAAQVFEQRRAMYR